LRTSQTLAALVQGSVLALLSMHCGGGLPVLHPARTLPVGALRAGAGFAGNAATGGLSDALGGARGEAAAHPNVPGAGVDETFARGALVAASIAPGLSPVVAARAGVGSQSEGGIAYTGRMVRIDMRRSFDLTSHWALSVGAGGSAALHGHQDGGALPNIDLAALHGWAADLPLLIGYQSDGDLYMLWVGARAGYEHVEVSDVSMQPSSGPPNTLTATRFWSGGLLGAAVGFRHIHVAMELDVSYASIEGAFDQMHAHVDGMTLTPSTALWWTF
jgi:hypothetical protein